MSSNCVVFVGIVVVVALSLNTKLQISGPKVCHIFVLSLVAKSVACPLSLSGCSAKTASKASAITKQQLKKIYNQSSGVSVVE